ncbi:MAG: tRNA-dihydrouridine synthase, partial [Ignavibacteriales bacterium]|nr:tRNA-dihydrouridine synthase [Ignavibacteriales bacterium]
EPDWSWINKVKEIVKIPVVLNGGIFTAEDVIQAFDETDADGVMIARGAIAHPWIFREAKELISKGSVATQVTFSERIQTALKHLLYSIELKDNERNAIIPFRKFYSGYLKGLYGASKIRQQLVMQDSYSKIEEILLNYKQELSQHYQ